MPAVSIHDPVLSARYHKRGLTMQTLRAQPEEWQQSYLNSLPPEDVDGLLRDWWFMAREEQLPPEGEWAFWIYLAGRGAGKTRTGAEWVRELIKQGFSRGGLIAPTAGDARDVMVEGESGLLAVCWDGDHDRFGNKMGKPLYEPSKRRVTWENGAQVTLFSADEPERLRGPQHEFIWADELCAWRRPETWDLAMFGLRLGQSPRAFISTTPKPKKLIMDLVDNEATVVTRGSTYSNRDNLAQQFFKTVITKYEGTTLGKQELEGLILREVEGALWTRDLIDRNRVLSMPTTNNPDFFFTRIVVAVDPAITSKQESDETGIVVVAIGNDEHCYVLADYSGTYKPGEWARKAAHAYHTWSADAIVAEGNQGGEMVAHTVHGVDQNLPVITVHASRGKVARAEPVQMLYEQNKVHHVGLSNPVQPREGELGALEDQMCTWEHLSGDKSPDRLDALVWGVTACMLGKGLTDQRKLKGFY